MLLPIIQLVPVIFLLMALYYSPPGFYRTIPRPRVFFFSFLAELLIILSGPVHNCIPPTHTLFPFFAEWTIGFNFTGTLTYLCSSDRLVTYCDTLCMYVHKHLTIIPASGKKKIASEGVSGISILAPTAVSGSARSRGNLNACDKRRY